MLTADRSRPCSGAGAAQGQNDPTAPGQTAPPQTARGSRGWTAVPCTGGSDGHVRQNQITPKYRLGGFLQVVQIQPYKI